MSVRWLWLVAFAPIIGLFFRGFVWGADSFAFWSLGCGVIGRGTSLNSHFWFTNLVPLLNCNFFYCC